MESTQVVVATQIAPAGRGPARWNARLVEAHLPWLYGSLALGFVAQRTAQTVLDAWYARSQYPVPYYVGQLSFSGERLQGWYSFMEGRGTLGVYWRTQFIDFGFVAATAVLFTVLAALVARAFPAGRGREIATRVVPFAAAGPGFDAVENCLSFLLLADPHHVNHALALVYSTAAALKFAGFAAVAGWTLAGLAAAVARWRRG
jgi:hypothetical protein